MSNIYDSSAPYQALRPLPQPYEAQAQNSALSNPIQAAYTLQNMRIQQQQQNAQRAIGQANQGAVDANGNYDPSKAIAAISQNPDAALGAGEGINAALGARNTQLTGNTIGNNLAASQFNTVGQMVAGFATDKNASQDKIANMLMEYGRANPYLPAPVLNSFNRMLYSQPNTTQGAQSAARQISNAMMGTNANQPSGAQTIDPVTGQPKAISQGQFTAGAAGGPSQGGMPGGGVPTAQAPGVAEAAAIKAKASGEQYSGDLGSANTYRTSVFPLEQAIPKLEALGKAGTGPGTDQLNQVKSFLQSLGVPGIDASKIQNYDEANKYLTDYVNRMAPGTNDKLAAAFAGNPSTKISNAAAVDVAKSALALRRMQQAQVNAFQTTGITPDGYSDWVSKNWATKTDPRAFGFDLMTPEAQNKLVSSLKGVDRQKFLFSLKAANSSGVITPPQANNGQQ